MTFSFKRLRFPKKRSWNVSTTFGAMWVIIINKILLTRSLLRDPPVGHKFFRNPNLKQFFQYKNRKKFF